MLSRPFAAAAILASLVAPAALAQKDAAPKGDKPAPAQSEGSKRVGDAYYLTTCPISGETLGAMGDAVVRNYDGREVRFCCKSCIKDFEKDVPASWGKVDETIVKDQLPHYPLDTSVVSGKKLDKPVNYVWNNRLVRLADESEKSEFNKDTRKYIAALDKAVIEKQSKTYTLKECPSTGEALDADSKDIVVANRLIRVCCGKCAAKILQSPAKFIAMVDSGKIEGAGAK